MDYRTKIVSVRVSDSEWKSLQIRAEALGMTPSGYMRWTALDLAEPAHELESFVIQAVREAIGRYRTEARTRDE